jgi:putative tricarboxylic transport membrane protein
VTADRGAAAALAIFGLAVSVQAWRLPYWLDRSPGPGFLPLWLGILLTGCATLLLVRAGRRAPADVPAESSRARGADPAALALITAIAAALVPAVGLIIAAGLLTAAAAWRLGQRRPFAIGTAAAITSALVWLVFVRWLGMPLP